MAAGRAYSNCLAIRKACDFLLSKELPGGGWGESYLSCQNKVGSMFHPYLFIQFHMEYTTHVHCNVFVG